MLSSVLSYALLITQTVTARSTAEIRKLDPTAIALFRQADVGKFTIQSQLILLLCANLLCRRIFERGMWPLRDRHDDLSII